jgi:hypothetical protein
MKGDDVLGPSGLAVKKSFATPDGTVRVLFSEDLKPDQQGGVRHPAQQAAAGTEVAAEHAG